MALIRGGEGPRRRRRATSGHERLAGAVLVLALAGGCTYSPGLTRLAERPVAPRAAPETPLLTAKECGDCHPVHYKEWRTSMHAFAPHSPAVTAFVAFVTRASGGTIGSFCIRCHTPIGISAGESPIRPNAERSEAARDGVGCITCHAAHTRDRQASGVFHVPVPGDPEPTIYGPYYGPDEAGGTDSADRLIAKTPHRSRRSDHITQAQFCGTCHDVFLPDGARLEEAFIEWKNGPYARAGIRCQDCHMSPIPGKPVPRSEWVKEPIVDDTLFPEAPQRYRTNHRFTGPDYALVADFGKEDLWMSDEEFEAWEAELEEDRKTLLRNAATMRVSHPERVRPGDRLRVRVAVTNSGAGHNLPTGFAAERQLWLEVIVRDAAGRQLYASGDLDRYGDLRDHASHEVHEGTVPLDRDLFNLQAKFVLRGFRGADSEAISTTNRLLDPVPFLAPAPTPASILGFSPTARIHKHGIPPLATKRATYGVDVPADARGPLVVSVRLRFRNFPPHLFRDIGIGELRDRLRIVDMQEYQSRVALVD